MMEAVSNSEAYVNIYRKTRSSIQEHLFIYIYIYIYMYRVSKKCIRILRDAQVVVRRNQKRLDADGNHFEHLFYLQMSNLTFIQLLFSV